MGGSRTGGASGSVARDRRDRETTGTEAGASRLAQESRYREASKPKKV